MDPDDRYDKIYADFHPKILKYLTRIAGANDAEDITQEVFDKINSGLRNFQGKSKLSTWIYRIATNTAIDRSRSTAYKHATEHIAIEEVGDHDPIGVPDDYKAPSIDQIVIRKEMSDCINEYIGQLPPDYKTVIVLKELEGLSNKEIAEILGISIDNAKIRLHRARTKLKSVLKEACEFYYTEQNTLACDRKQIQILPNTPK